MAWTLPGFDLDLLSLTLPLAKAIGGGLCGFFLKKVWRYVMPAPTDIRCRIKGCDGFKQSNTKGLCMKCYKSAKNKVEAGLTTWEHLAHLGLCEGEKGSAFDEAYNQATGDN